MILQLGNNKQFSHKEHRKENNRETYWDIPFRCPSPVEFVGRTKVAESGRDLEGIVTYDFNTNESSLKKAYC